MSMQFQFEQPPEGDDGPSYLTKPGFYHVAIMDQNPAPMNYDETQYLDGLKLDLSVAAGTHPDQFDKTFELLLVKGNVNQKDGGKFCNRKLLKLMLATGMVGEHAPGQATTVDTSLMVGRQFIIEVESKPNSSGSKNPTGTHIELKSDCIYHIDDPAVKDVPKHPYLLAVIPKELRRHPSTFKTEGPGPAAGGAAAASPTQPTGPKPKLSVAQMIGAPAGAAAATAQVADVADV